MANLYRMSMGGGSSIEPYTVVVTLDENFSGQTVTMSQTGQTTLTKTCPTSEPYTVSFKPMWSGVWAVTSTTIDGTTVQGQTEDLGEWKTYYIKITNGLDYEEWLIKGGVTETYSSLDEVLADEETVRRLMTVHDSVDFLANNVTEADATTIFATDLCAKWINLRDYALDTLYASAVCKSAMDTADKYFYGEWALVGKVPTMTSDTAPYGEVIYNGTTTSSYPQYNIFNGGDGVISAGTSDNQTGKYVGYKFVSPICIKEVTYSSPTRVTKAKIQASNDGSAWVDVSEEFSVDTLKVTLNNDTKYQYYAFVNTAVSGNGQTSIANLQFYAWEAKGNVPVMTSNTAPYGTASVDFTPYGSTSAYNAFDGSESTGLYGASGTKYCHVTYQFTNPVCAKKIHLYLGNSQSANYSIKGSNDNSTWTELKSGTFTETEQYFLKDITFDNSAYYMYYYFEVTGASATPWLSVIQYYGRTLSVSIPTMTSDTEPWGTITASSINYGVSGREAYRAFDKSTSTGWWGSSLPTLLYDFGHDIHLKECYLRGLSGSGDSTVEYCFETSEDGVTWTQFGDTQTTSNNSTVTVYVSGDEVTARYVRYKTISSTQNDKAGVFTKELNFYGLDYSEREFATGSTMKYIYDHGIGEVTVSGTSALTSLDTTDYSLLRAIDTGTATTSDKLVCGSANAVVNELPYNNYLDISSCNGTNETGFSIRTNIDRLEADTELWLE